MKDSIFNHTPESLANLFESWGFRRFCAHQVLKWVYHHFILDYHAMHNISKALREKMASHFNDILPQIIHHSISDCNTHKWLMRFDEGSSAIETVYIPELKRATLCISSQIGCALACQFCATGLQGFSRNLNCGEIIVQVWLAAKVIRDLPAHKALPEISNIVFMGMGEPLLNENSVFSSIDLLLNDHAFGFSRHKVTVSTSGIIPAICRLQQRSKVQLALSLHAPNDDLRSKIVPINKKYPLKDLLSACDAYTKACNMSITHEYVMLKGLNDQIEHAKALAMLLKNRKAKVNLIPYNPVKGINLAKSELQTIQNFQKVLIDHKIITTIRKTRGDKIEAACGQLAGKIQGQSKSIASYAFRTEQASDAV